MGIREDLVARFELMSMFFNPTYLNDKVILQFRLTAPDLGDEDFTGYFLFNDKRCKFCLGEASSWDTRIVTTLKLWSDLQTGSVSKTEVVRQLLLKRDLVVQGNILYFFILPKIFGGVSAGPGLPSKIREWHHGMLTRHHWETPKRIVVLSGSHKSSKQTSVTYRLSSLFANGLASATPTPQIDLINLYDYHIRECNGCIACWGRLDTKLASGCVHEDDFSQIIYPLILKCDLLIYSFPIYSYAAPPVVQKVLNKFFSTNYPICYVDNKLGINYYNRRPYRFSAFQLINCGGMRLTHMTSAIYQLQLCCQRHGIRYLGNLRRGAGYTFAVGGARTPMTERIEQAIVESARELVEKGKIRHKTKRLAEQNAYTEKQLSTAHNLFCLTKAGKLHTSMRKNDFRTSLSPFDIDPHRKRKKVRKHRIRKQFRRQSIRGNSTVKRSIFGRIQRRMNAKRNREQTQQIVSSYPPSRTSYVQ